MPDTTQNDRHSFRRRVTEFSADHPKLVFIVAILLTVALGAMIPMIRVDTDPENMLSEDEFVRVFHNEVKKEFALYDMIVLGVVNESDRDGVFNPETLAKVYKLSQAARRIDGVIDIDVIAPDTVDNIEQAGPGTVRFEWLMSKPPATREDARRIRDNALDNHLLRGTLVSEDGKALCLYVPIVEKNVSYRVAKALQGEVTKLGGPERYYITGLPVAEDTFGVEMFIQMAITAPLSMLIIFALMFLFFRKLVLALSPLLLAMITVICTMGLLIGTGNTVHIMSSMIPIFLMPIAVIDTVHILSSFFDRYQLTRDRRRTIVGVMDELFIPMLYTSLTSAAGFGSMTLTPIPPVQVFGFFVAFGIMLAWVLTITLIPAYIMFIKESSLENFGASSSEADPQSLLSKLLTHLGALTYRRAKLIFTLSLVTIAVAVYGISRIQINDNPVKWFSKSHPIRVADRVLNEHFAGTYMAYLILSEKKNQTTLDAKVAAAKDALQAYSEEYEVDFPDLTEAAREAVTELERRAAAARSDEQFAAAPLLGELRAYADERSESAADDVADAWEEVATFFDEQYAAAQTFKQPEVLLTIERLQEELQVSGDVGKSNSVADVVKKVYYEMMEGDKQYDKIPDTGAAVAQSLLTFQNSHNPDDLWHLVTPDYSRASLWLQLKSGDNRAMERVVGAVADFFETQDLPVALDHQWAGLTYLNVVWQDKMVVGMIKSFAGSFIIVLVMMVFLFRSLSWGLLSMLPLMVTITFVYGLIGIVGKDYDMPVAVLSSLTLGLSIDFAIHFLERGRAIQKETGSWEKAVPSMFAEPARAISRNGLLVAIGFLPLLAAPLVPYKTVGFFMAAIMAVSGVGTLFILPALMRLMERVLFPAVARRPAACNCATCIGVTIAAMLAVAYGFHRYGVTGWAAIVWMGIAGVLAAAVTCYQVAKREACRLEEQSTQTEENDNGNE